MLSQNNVFKLQYAKFVKPSFDEFILPSKKYADVIIPRGGDNYVAIDLIVQHIRTKLGQHELCKIYTNLSVIHSTFQVLRSATISSCVTLSLYGILSYKELRNWEKRNDTFLVLAISSDTWDAHPYT